MLSVFICLSSLWFDTYARESLLDSSALFRQRLSNGGEGDSSAGADRITPDARAVSAAPKPIPKNPKLAQTRIELGKVRAQMSTDWISILRLC